MWFFQVSYLWKCQVEYWWFVLGILVICPWNTCDPLLTYFCDLSLEYLWFVLDILSICLWHTYDFHLWNILEYLRYVCLWSFLPSILVILWSMIFKKYPKYGSNRKYTQKIASSDHKYGDVGILKSQVRSDMLEICYCHSCDLYLTYLWFIPDILVIYTWHTCEFHIWHTCDMYTFGRFCTPYLWFCETYLRCKSQVYLKKNITSMV